MENHSTELDSIPGHHYTSLSQLTPFLRHSFRSGSTINMATIQDIFVHPSALYLSSKGEKGTCWRIHVAHQDKDLYYDVRNFRDLVHHYEKNGYAFS